MPFFPLGADTVRARAATGFTTSLEQLFLPARKSGGEGAPARNSLSHAQPLTSQCTCQLVALVGTLTTEVPVVVSTEQHLAPVKPGQNGAHQSTVRPPE